MPMIFLTQAEQQRLVRMIKKELATLDEDKRCEKYYREEFVANVCTKEDRTALRKISHNRDSRTTEKIAKRVSLLKKIKHPEDTILALVS